jgi:hypothetical protein
MTTEAYHELENVAEVKDASELKISRAKALLSAVLHHRDYSLLKILRHPVDDISTLECFIVEVECDDVPPKNPFGIRYRERLALCVPDDPKNLVEVLALRRDFPILMHQNQGGHDAPASLCLYFEPPASVTRTWTPQAFLRRIQWWMEKSARGELHPADQPVEHLFFASKYELVLPWNLDDLQKTPNLRFVVVLRQERPDGGFTCFLEPLSEATKKASATTHIELTLPPIVHGLVERDPATLGQLADLLQRRGVDLVNRLRTALQADVGEHGVAASANDKGTIILLHAPIKRSADVEPDLISHRAFLVQSSALELGAATGALFVLDGRYYRESSLNPEPSTAWREHPILAMQVFTQNDAAAARRQSGITEEGPASVLVGAGSLGSALLNIWGRSGWGRWTVIDDDHIKPHNLSRHQAYAQHIGAAKAMVAAGLHAAAMKGATEMVPIVADACDVTQESVATALSSAALVIDASTVLEYPRAASAVDSLPRHFSAFVTPNGNAAVLLAEDAKRLKRLRTLEAQYYRALIQQDWGKIHLEGHAGTFWSGASCRDISLVMPYSRILGHACTLAEQIQVAARREQAQIRIWQRNPLNGGAEVYDVPVVPERRIALGEFDLFVDEGVEEQLRALRQQAFPDETGGVLLGYYDLNIKAVVVVAGLPAPPDSEASPGSFERGIAGLGEAVQDAGERTAGMVGYIGEWHSHPAGHSASPSRHDLEQLIHLALGMADDGLPAVQLIVGEQDLQILQGEAR